MTKLLFNFKFLIKKNTWNIEICKVLSSYKIYLLEILNTFDLLISINDKKAIVWDYGRF